MYKPLSTLTLCKILIVVHQMYSFLLTEITTDSLLFNIHLSSTLSHNHRWNEKIAIFMIDFCKRCKKYRISWYICSSESIISQDNAYVVWDNYPLQTIDERLRKTMDWLKSDINTVRYWLSGLKIERSCSRPDVVSSSTTYEIVDVHYWWILY